MGFSSLGGVLACVCVRAEVGVERRQPGLPFSLRTKLLPRLSGWQTASHPPTPSSPEENISQQLISWAQVICSRCAGSPR